jgi:hypothetical protein
MPSWIGPWELLIMWVAPIALALWLARRRGRSSLTGLVAAFFLSWVGVLVVYLLPDRSLHGVTVARSRGAGKK